MGKVTDVGKWQRWARRQDGDRNRAQAGPEGQQIGKRTGRANGAGAGRQRRRLPR